MSIKDYKDPIVSQWHMSGDTKYSKLIHNEPHTVTGNMFALVGLPDVQERVTIDGMVEINFRDKIAKENQFKVDYTNGHVFVHKNKEGQSINVVKYASRGVSLYPASRVWTKLSADGRVIETMDGAFDVLDSQSAKISALENVRIHESTTKPTDTRFWYDPNDNSGVIRK